MLRSPHVRKDSRSYFVTRASATAPIEILGSFDWAVAWLVEFDWSLSTMKPTSNMRRSELLPGEFCSGAPGPLENFASIAVNRTQPTTNKQDESTVDAIFTRRRQPMLTESRTLPNGFRSDLFK